MKLGKRFVMYNQSKMSKRTILSFQYAWNGILTALKDEPNLKVHFLITIVVLGLGLYFNLTRGEWIVLYITIGLVLAVELTNTAIEEIVNSFTSEVHPGAKKAKDVAAGAVLVVSFFAITIGLLIFLPYIVDLL